MAPARERSSCARTGSVAQGEEQLRFRDRGRCRVDARVKDSAQAVREHEGVVGEQPGDGPMSAREMHGVEDRRALPGGREEAGGRR